MPNCAYHPDRPAMDRCTECARDICSDCRTEVAGKPVCTGCVEAIRSRVAAEMAAPVQAPAGFGSTSQPTGFRTTDPYTTQTSAGAAYQMSGPIVQEAPNPARILVGIVAGVAVGVIGAFILKSILYYAKFGLSYFNIILGGAVGFAVMLGSGRKGPLIALISAGLAFAAMMFSDYMLLTALAGDQFGSSIALGTIPLSLFLEAQKDQGVMHWICVAIGVYSAFSICVDKGTQP
jgi:hypothetical protein